MEIERKGANCVVINIKKSIFVIDPKLGNYGLKDQGSGATAQLLTQTDLGVPTADTVIINGAGEYEVSNCSIRGIAARKHGQPDNAPKSATIYHFDYDDTSVVIFGNVQTRLSEEDQEAIGVVDVLIIPVGGYGLSIEPKEAVDLIRTLEPKVVIPTHYKEEGVQFEVPQAPLEDFLKELGAKHEDPTPKLKLKTAMLPDTLTVYELLRTK